MRATIGADVGRTGPLRVGSNLGRSSPDCRISWLRPCRWRSVRLKTATIAPLAATFFSVSSDMGGKLTVSLDAPGFAARLSLVDAEGQPLVQSDGLATGAGDGLIDVNVPAGMDFLEVQSLSGGGTYQITANLVPTVPAFQTVPTGSFGRNPIAAGKFFGSSSPR